MKNIYLTTKYIVKDDTGNTIGGYYSVGTGSASNISQETYWSAILNKPTTVTGFGITDVYTKTESDNKYLLNITDTFTGILSLDGTLKVNTIEDYSGGNLILQPTAGNVGIGTTSPSSTLEVDGTITNDSYSGTVAYSSGWTGTGTEFKKDASNKYNLELDNLRVRGSMHIYELIVDKIRAANGSLWVSDGQQAIVPDPDTAGVTTAGLYFKTTGTYIRNWYYFTDGDLNTFATDDLIKAQRFDGTNITSSEYVVVATDGNKTYVRGFGTERSDFGGTAGGMTLINVDINSWTATGTGYDILTNAGGQEFKTVNFTITGKGQLRVTIEYTAGTEVGTWAARVLDSAGFEIGHPEDITLDGSGSEELIFDVIFENGEGGRTQADGYFSFISLNAATGMDDFIITSISDETIVSNDVDGFDFVRMGNLTDTDRQGALYLTASDTNAPYLEIINDMDTFIIGADNKKVRLGNLTGIVDTDLGTLSGYGLYSDNAYLKGTIVASAGEIGGWTLDTDAIYAGGKSTANGYNAESAGGITLAADGSIHAENFYIDIDGDIGFKTTSSGSRFELEGATFSLYPSTGVDYSIRMNNLSDRPQMFFQSTTDRIGIDCSVITPGIKYTNLASSALDTWELRFNEDDGGSAAIYGNLEFRREARLNGKIIKGRTLVSTANNYLDDDISFVMWNYSTASSNLYLPSNPSIGQEIVFINSTTARTCILQGNGNNINDAGGQSSTATLAARHAITLIYEGTNWHLIAYK